MRDKRILAAVDGWLTELADDDHLIADVAAILAADQPVSEGVITLADRRA